MNEEMREELLQALESAANFMRGMSFDPALPSDRKSALTDKAMEIEAVIEMYIE